ncbi:MAG TPA: hypothetical protein VGB77_06330 [Abditibacteriaceae bacterium]|jgi:hypothetical protein
MLELHENEQYFFAPETVKHLADFAAQWERPCCLCAPLVGAELEKRGIEAITLDCDERFSHLKSYRHFDLFRPQWQGEEFGLIICDPPFFKVSLAQLFNAIRVLSRYDFKQPLLMCYLTRRATNLCGTFTPFNLEATGYHPTYQTVRNLERNEIEFFGNLGEEWHNRMRDRDNGI